MPRNTLTRVVGAGLALAALSLPFTYQVRDSEVAVLLTFDRATTSHTSPGPHLKLPWPIQKARVFDARLRILRTPLERITTADKQTLRIGAFLLWRIDDPQVFLKQLGDLPEAQAVLEGIARDALRDALSEVPFSGLVSPHPDKLRFTDVEQAMLASVAADARPLGLEVTQAGLRRVALPAETAETVFQRMSEERQAQAETIRAHGTQRAGEILAHAEGLRRQRLEAARARAREILAQAERDASAAYAALSSAPDLAVFLERLEALSQLLRGRSSLVFTPDLPPFDLLSPLPPPSPPFTHQPVDQSSAVHPQQDPDDQ